MLTRPTYPLKRPKNFSSEFPSAVMSSEVKSDIKKTPSAVCQVSGRTLSFIRVWEAVQVPPGVKLTQDLLFGLSHPPQATAMQKYLKKI